VVPGILAAHRILAGLFVILLLDAAISATIWMSWDVDRWTSVLLLPYLAWTIFATALNAKIWTLNRNAIAV
jgi:benzodiazapine receptor